MKIYGKNPVREALRGKRRVARIWIDGKLGDERWVAEGKRAGCAVTVASGGELTGLCGSGDHQGAVAEVEPFAYADAAGLFRGSQPLVVALDQVQDPQNLGAVARVAECAGASGMIVPERRSAAVTAAVCRSSAGAVEHLPVARVKNLARSLAEAKRHGAWVYGASAAPAGTIPYSEPDYRGPVVLVLGSEGRGLRKGVADACDVLLRIPLHGQIESLNVAAAAATLLFEITRQRLDIIGTCRQTGADH